MTARTTFEVAVKSAGATAVASGLTNETIRQATIDLQNSVVGYNNGGGSYAALAAAVKSATAAKLVADNAVEAAKQASLGAARDALRVAADFGPL
jgi:hypothetical protein